MDYYCAGLRHKYNWAMNYKKDQAVSVKDCNGRGVPLRVWKDKGPLILVASDEVFRLLELGKTTLWPLGFARKDVFPIKKRSRQA